MLDSAGYGYHIEFEGKWIINPDEEMRAREPESNLKICFAAAILSCDKSPDNLSRASDTAVSIISIFYVSQILISIPAIETYKKLTKES